MLLDCIRPFPVIPVTLKDCIKLLVIMLLSSGWTIPDLDNKYKENFPDRNSWGILPYPQGTEKASATGSWCYGVTDNGVEDKTATMLVFDFLTSAESAVEITNATGMIPARKSVENNYQNGSPE